MLFTQQSVANIYVLDNGIQGYYYNTLKPRLLRESCYSYSRDDRIINVDTNTGAKIYSYKWASLCRNKLGVMHGTKASMLRTTDLPAQRGGRQQDGTPFPDRNITVTTDNHQTNIAGILVHHTSDSVKQWHAHSEGLAGVNRVTQQYVYSPGFSLTRKTPDDWTRVGNALQALASGDKRGVVAVNLSFDDRERYSTPCDNNSSIFVNSGKSKTASAIRRLNASGIAVVAATANSTGSNERDNKVLPFPACLSSTVAVAAVRSNTVYGAINGHIDFIHSGGSLPTSSGTSTSYATPRVVAQLAELKSINPSASINTILNVSRQSGTQICGQRSYNNGRIRHQFCYTQPNLARARNAITDPFWSDQIKLEYNKTKSAKLGWNYGTSRHENGAISYFKTTPFTQRSQKLSPDSLAVSATAGTPTLRFSFRAYDIDSSNEVSVLVNDKLYGYLKRTSSNQLGSTQTFCISPKDLASNGSNNQIKLKLRTSKETWGVTNLKIENGVVDSSCQQGPPTFPPLPNNGDRLQGSNAAYGNAYIRERKSSVPLSFTLGTNLKPTTSSYKTNSVLRDVRLKFTTKSGESNSTDNGTQVYINGQRLFVTEYFSGRGERNYDFIINRKHLKAGRNTFEFRPRDSGTNAIWGIRGISIEYIAPISLNVGSTKSGTFGYNQSPKRYTGLRANFNLPQVANDYSFSVSGWDIDVSNETQVFINGRSLGYLNKTANNAYGSANTFLLKRSYLIRGNNQIEFVQRYPSSSWTGVENEKWAVKSLRVRVLKPDLKVSLVQIIDSKLKPNVPFSVKATVLNSGVGSSNASNVRYLVSTDKRITRSDTLIGTSGLASTPAGRSRTVSKSLRTNLVNKNRYFGVCVDVVPNEISNGNNCSSGIQLKSKAITAPMIMLLLGDD